MKTTRDIAFALILTSLLSTRGQSDELTIEERVKNWEERANHTYGELNNRLGGKLTPLFRSLAYGHELHQEYFQEDNREKHEAYRQFFVQALVAGKDGNVGEAMFVALLLRLTPPDTVLSLIASELGPEGKLHGILAGKHNDIAKHIQRQPQQGHIGKPNFIEYVYYLKGGKSRGYKSTPNTEEIVLHMFATDPQEAFLSMLWADYGFNPHVRGNAYQHCDDDAENVRTLQVAHADITDYLYRSRYKLPMHRGMKDKVQARLKSLNNHERSWVRLYAACLLKLERRLRSPDLLESLGKSTDSRVLAVAQSIRDEE